MLSIFCRRRTDSFPKFGRILTITVPKVPSIVIPRKFEAKFTLDLLNHLNPMTHQRRVLITGVSGLLGANLVRHFAPKSDCTGWFGSNPISFEGATAQQIDITDHQSVSAALDRTKPDLIIHCAAATDVEWCEKNPDLARAINEDATGYLAKKAVELGAKFVYTSTDSVFDGKSGNYSESDPPGPLNSYAAGKARTESLIATIDPDALIIRSYFYGYSPSGKRSLVEWVLTRTNAGIEVAGFSDSYFSPISVLDFADALDAALDSGIVGLLHLGSSDSVSKYEFAEMVMRKYECDMSLLRSITVDDIGLSADRPRNTSLDVTLLESILGKPVPTAKQGLDRLVSDSVLFA